MPPNCTKLTQSICVVGEGGQGAQLTSPGKGSRTIPNMSTVLTILLIPDLIRNHPRQCNLLNRRRMRSQKSSRQLHNKEKGRYTATNTPPTSMTAVPSNRGRKLPSPNKSRAHRMVRTALNLKSAVT